MDTEWKSRKILFFKERYEAACAVIDLIAEEIGIDKTEYGDRLYRLNTNGESVLVAKLNDFLKADSKTALKKQVAELERKNKFLKEVVFSIKGEE